jgi:hypothetical protein
MRWLDLRGLDGAGAHVGLHLSAVVRVDSVEGYSGRIRILLLSGDSMDLSGEAATWLLRCLVQDGTARSDGSRSTGSRSTSGRSTDSGPAVASGQSRLLEG